MRLSPLSQVRSAITGKNRFPVTIRQIQERPLHLAGMAEPPDTWKSTKAKKTGRALPRSPGNADLALCHLPAAVDRRTTRPDKNEIGCVDRDREPYGSGREATFYRAPHGIVARVFGDKRNRQRGFGIHGEDFG